MMKIQITIEEVIEIVANSMGIEHSNIGRYRFVQPDQGVPFLELEFDKVQTNIKGKRS